MILRRSLAVATALSLCTVLLSHAADPAPSDSSKTMARSEPAAKEEVLRTTHTGDLVKDVTSREARLRLNKESEFDRTLESLLSRSSSGYEGRTAEVPFAPPVAEEPVFPWADQPPAAGQTREADIGSELRYLAHTLRDTARKHDLEIETLSRGWAAVRDEELIQRQRTFVLELRTVAEAAEARARDIESDTAR